MIVWRGLGILVLFIAAAALFGGQFATDKAFGPGYWQQNAWPAPAAVVFAGAVCWFLGRRLNKPARKDANPRRPWTHDFLFLKMENWAYPLALAAVAVFVTGFKPGDSVRTVKAAAEQTTRLTPGAK